MPVPIRPNHANGFTNNHNEPNSGLNLNVDTLSNMLNTLSASIEKEADVADNDAETIFKLWEKSEILKDSSNIEDRVYKISEDIPQNTIIRLKSRGLLYGEKDQIRFTSHAAKIIKIMVLSEGNSFGKKSVKKPYSVILAETKAPKRKNNLAVS